MTQAQREALLVQQPQQAQLYLSVYKPPIMLQALINSGALTKGSMAIPYDNVTTGSYGTVWPGMTMYIGTTLGDNDVGTIRVRSITSTVVTVAENYEIHWQDNLYITIIKFNEVWPVVQRVIVSTGTHSQCWKDYDIAWPGDDAAYKFPVWTMGSHWAGFKGVVNNYQSGIVWMKDPQPASNTFTWDFEGGNVAHSTSTGTVGVTYSTPGYYTTTLSVVQGGITGSSYRQVSIYDRPGEGPNVPIQKFTLDSLSGSRRDNGYTATITVQEQIPSIIAGALVCVFGDFQYGSTKLDANNNVLDLSNEQSRIDNIFVGYIQQNSIQYAYDRSSVTFTVVSPIKMLDQCTGPSLRILDDRDKKNDGESEWFYMYRPTTYKFLMQYVKWHSTYLTCNDLVIDYNTNILGQPAEINDSEQTSMLSFLVGYMKNTLLGEAVCDRRGVLYLSENSLAPDPSHINTKSDINIWNHNWINEPQITETEFPAITSLELNGVAYNNISGTWHQMISVAPNEFTTMRGKAQHEVLPGLALIDQSQLNTLCQTYYSYANSRYQLNVTMKGMYLNMDIAPSMIEHVTIQPGDTIRNVLINNVPFLLTDIQWRYTPIGYSLMPDAILRQVDTGWSGLAMTVTPPPPPTYPTAPPYPVPPDPVPPYPPYPPLPPYPPFPPFPPYPPYPVPPYPIPNLFRTFGWSFVFSPTDGGTNVVVGYAEVPFNCVVERVTLVADAVGSIVVDIWRDLYALFPPTALDSICSLTLPTLGSAQKYQNIVLPGWQRILYAGDILAIAYSGSSGLALCTLAIYGERLLV
jgi:PKD repeat protein